MTSTCLSRSISDQKAEDLRRRAFDCIELEEKLIFLRSAVQYSPEDRILLSTLANQLHARGVEVQEKQGHKAAVRYFEEAEQYLQRRNYLLARQPQAVQLYGVLSKQYLKVLLAKMECYASEVVENTLRDGRELSFQELLRRVTKYVPELDADASEDPKEIAFLRYRIYDHLHSLCKAKAAVDEEEGFNPHSLYSLLIHSGYLETLYEADSSFRVGEIENFERHRSLSGFKVRIFGAGVSGLTLAYSLKRRGADIVGLLDKRGEGQQQHLPLAGVLSRGQNVSWTGLERYLRPILGKEDYEDLLQRLYANGAIMDRTRGKVRGSIASFQEVLVQLLEEQGVKVTPGYKGGVADLLTDRDIDLQCVATGVHALDDFSCELKPLTFNDKSCRIRTHLTMYPSKELSAYRHESRVEGVTGGNGWRNVHEVVYPATTFESEITRFAANLQRLSASEEAIQEVLSLHSAERVAHRFSFGNDRSGFECGLNSHPQPTLTSTLTITPWVLKSTISHVNPRVPTLFLGDATCSTHPLAAIGHALVFQNVNGAVRLAECRHALKHFPSEKSPAHLQRLVRSLNRDSEDLYERCGRKMALMVFLQSCLCSFYSQLRGLP